MTIRALPAVPGNDHPELRAAVRSWLAENVPAGADTSNFDPFDYHRGGYDRRVWEAALAAQRWSAPSWPKEYGGGGYSRSEALAISEELAAAGAPPPLDAVGLSIVGPALCRVASEEQRLRWLPPIARGEVTWCQLFSEPDHGSDLASMDTVAVDTGDGYLVTGQKIWTSNADHASRGLLVTRVAGTSGGGGRPSYVALVIDMTRSEVEVRPIVQPHGQATFCEVFLDEVPVPLSDCVGGPGGGWHVAIATLLYERGALGGFGFGLTAPLLAAAATIPPPGAGGRDGALAVLCGGLVHHMWARRTALADPSAQGPPGGTEWFPLKIAFARHNQRLADLIWRSQGAASALGTDQNAARAMLRSRANTIEGGTSEILLSNVGERILGLPREPRG